jgi:hypothetical protein
VTSDEPDPGCGVEKKGINRLVVGESNAICSGTAGYTLHHTRDAACKQLGSTQGMSALTDLRSYTRSITFSPSSAMYARSLCSPYAGVGPSKTL